MVTAFTAILLSTFSVLTKLARLSGLVKVTQPAKAESGFTFRAIFSVVSQRMAWLESRKESLHFTGCYEKESKISKGAQVPKPGKVLTINVMTL